MARPVRAVGPTGSDERLLAPDLARGAVLLVIALAHAPAYLYGRDLVAGRPSDPSEADTVVTFWMTLTVEGRGYPMFAAMFGYGAVQLLHRQIAAGSSQIAAIQLLRRRGSWLLVFGLVHAALLWPGDILGAYGVVAVVAAGMLLRGSDRTFLLVAAMSLTVVAVGGVAAVLAVSESAVIANDGVGEPWAVGTRLIQWTPTLLLQPLGLLGAVLAGAWAARRRVLEEPGAHRRLLVGVAAGGLTAAIAGGVPEAIAVTGGLIEQPLWVRAAAGGLHYVSGYGGIGYAAFVVLVAERLPAPPGRVATAVAACGQRSLTCYLAQSVLFAAAMAPYAGRLGERAGVAGSALVAVGVWAATLGGAVLIRRRGRRGPAESLLRRLTYGQVR